MHITESGEEYEEVHLLDFPPGSIMVLKVSLPSSSLAAMQQLCTLVQDDAGRLSEALAELNFVDLNVLLYRSPVEEFASTGDKGYNIANYGYLAYCGLQVIHPHIILIT